MVAGLFYLPRLCVYHSGTKANSPEYKIFITMERKLMKYIMNPSMILTWFFGNITCFVLRGLQSALVKSKICFSLSYICFFICTVRKYEKIFENNINRKDDKFFRWINEVPTILFLLIVFLVVFQPSL